MQHYGATGDNAKISAHHNAVQTSRLCAHEHESMCGHMCSCMHEFIRSQWKLSKLDSVLKKLCYSK